MNASECLDVRSPVRAARRRIMRSCKLLALALAAVIAVLGVWLRSDSGTIFLMRFFRDLSRAKSRARLFEHGATSLVPLFLGRDDPLAPLELAGGDGQDDATWITPEDLASYDGRDPSSPLYLAIRGRIYDVSSGTKFYGLGRSYHHFVGRDASRAFATGCFAEECLSPSLVGLTAAQLRELDRWLELYEFHDKQAPRSPPQRRSHAPR